MSKSKVLVKETSIGIIQEVINKILPGLGSAINEALFGVAGRVQQNRINEFVLYLRSQMLELQLENVDMNYLKSEDFYDLTRTIFESVIKTKSKEKHKALAKVYLNGIIEKTDLDKDLTAIFSKFIVELMPQQIQIILFIEKHENNLIEIGTYSKFYGSLKEEFEYFTWGLYEFKYYCSDLENKALVSFGAGLVDYYSTSQLIALEDHKEASVKLSDLGKQFIEFLKE